MRGEIFHIQRIPTNQFVQALQKVGGKRLTHETLTRSHLKHIAPKQQAQLVEIIWHAPAIY